MLRRCDSNYDRSNLKKKKKNLFRIKIFTCSLVKKQYNQTYFVYVFSLLYSPRFFFLLYFASTRPRENEKGIEEDEKVAVESRISSPAHNSIDRRRNRAD